MGMFAEATGSIRRLPKFFGLVPVRVATTRISDGQLDDVLHQVENATLGAKNLVAGRSHHDLATSLGATSWSVVECLDHLAQTATAFIPAISSAVARAPRLTTNRPLRTGALTRLFIRNLEPPYRLRFKVPQPLVPRRHDYESAWSAFEESQVQLARTIESASGLAIDQVSVESPVYARFRYNVYGALRMLAAHERRHLWQMQQILKALDLAQVHNAS
ncbi:MAG: DinB family protein [Terriglobales bacterium]